MAVNTVVNYWPSNRMSDADYEHERAQIRATYGDSKGSAGARFEQELAKLFYRSGWTQEQLAKKEGKSQRWVSYSLLFARFLEFSTTGAKIQNPAFSKLTERRFRDYWSRTDKAEGNERIRFQAVLRLMEDETTLVKAKVAPIRPRIIDGFADGKWHRLGTIAQKVDEPEELVQQALRILVNGASPKVKCERKQVGSSWSYRLFPIRKDRAISSLELAEKLGPIIDGLAAEGKKNMATMSPGTVAKLAHELKALIDEWVQ